MLRRIVLFLLSFIVLIVPFGSAEANGDTIPDGIPSESTYYTNEYTVVFTEGSNEREQYFANVIMGVSSISTGKVTINMQVNATSTMQKLGIKRLVLQHWNGSSWDNIWTKDDQYLTDTDYFPYLKTISNLASDDYYRFSVILLAKKGLLDFQNKVVVSNYIRCL